MLTELIDVKERLREQEILRHDLLVTVENLAELEMKQKKLAEDLSLAKMQFLSHPEDAVSFISLAHLQVKEEMLITLILPGDKTASAHYFVYPFTIEVLGYYPAILKFIDELGKTPASRVSFLDLEKTETGEMLKGVITWEVYLLLDDEQWVGKREEIDVNLKQLEVGRQNLFQIPEQFRQFLIPATAEESSVEIPIELPVETTEVPLENATLTVTEEKPVFYFSSPYSFPIKRQ